MKSNLLLERRRTESALASVPGKTFLLGEYAVLEGRRALVAAVGPRFGLNRDGAATEFHPRSPAGRLLALARSRGFEPGTFAFEDSFSGEGGFGASTAQFALVYRALAPQAGWELSAIAARRAYRELMADEILPPSGADLVAQWSGGVVCFDPAHERVEQLWNPQEGDDFWSNVLIFSAAGQPGRKVPTHEHLAALGDKLSSTLVDELAAVVKCGEQAVARKDAVALGRALSAYAEQLAGAGLELPAARADRVSLNALPGVLGVKGTGALLADAVVMLLEAGGSARAALRADVIAAARSRGLKLVADGLRFEAGLETA